MNKMGDHGDACLVDGTNQTIAYVFPDKNYKSKVDEISLGLYEKCEWDGWIVGSTDCF